MQYQTVGSFLLEQRLIFEVASDSNSLQLKSAKI